MLLKIAVIILIILAFAIFLVIGKALALNKALKSGKVSSFLSANRQNARLMLVFLVIGAGALFWYIPIASEHFLPESASLHGEDLDQLFWIITTIALVVFAITQVLLFVFAYKYRFNPGKKAFHYPENNRLEILWTIVPALTFITLFGLGQDLWWDMMVDEPEDAVVVEITGMQFNWLFRYPGSDGELGNNDYRLIDPVNAVGIDFSDQASFDDFMARRLYLPVDTAIELKIRARDVMHSVFLPHFRVKMDAVPGMPTRFTFTPRYTTRQMRKKTGDEDFDYELACTELCGRGHFGMKATVKVVSKEKFAQWKKEQEPFLNKNPDYMSKIPTPLKQLAQRKSGIVPDKTNQ